MRLPKADHQVRYERQALLFLPGALSHLDPGHISGEVVLRQFFSEATGAGDHFYFCRRLRREVLVGPGDHAGDTPLQELRVPGPPGPRVDRDLAGGVAGVKYQAKRWAAQGHVRGLRGRLERLVGPPRARSERGVDPQLELLGKPTLLRCEVRVASPLSFPGAGGGSHAGGG